MFNSNEKDCHERRNRGGGVIAEEMNLTSRRPWLRWLLVGSLQALLLGLPLGYLVWKSGRQAERRYGGIGCREVLSLLRTPEEGWAAERRLQVQTHLRLCGNCSRIRQHRDGWANHDST
mgnify:CR=1 FL=1